MLVTPFEQGAWSGECIIHRESPCKTYSASHPGRMLIKQDDLGSQGSELYLHNASIFGLKFKNVLLDQGYTNPGPGPRSGSLCGFILPVSKPFHFTPTSASHWKIWAAEHFRQLCQPRRPVIQPSGILGNRRNCPEHLRAQIYLESNCVGTEQIAVVQMRTAFSEHDGHDFGHFCARQLNGFVTCSLKCFQYPVPDSLRGNLVQWA